jgi:sulfite reductase (ferredoxin)
METARTDSTELDDVAVKISGCPNSCGQHHIAAIGFHGGAKKVNGILAPHYEMMLGGRISENQAVFGTSVIKIPSKNVAEAVRRTLENFRKEKQVKETFLHFFDRKGKAHFMHLLDDLKNLPGIETAPDSYIDFHSTERFSLEDRGQGECAGAVTDMIQDHLAMAERTLFQSKLSLEKNQFKEAVEHANQSIVASARGLLVTEGMDFTDDMETMRKFESLVIDSGIVSEEFSGIAGRFEENTARADAAMVARRRAEAERIFEQSRHAYDKMRGDKSLRLRVGPTGNAQTDASRDDGKSARVEAINLLGIKCPFNYVKTKLKLETMESGRRLEVLLDDGEPVKNVPKSVQNDGHKLISLDKIENHYKMIVEKA